MEVMHWLNADIIAVIAFLISPVLIFYGQKSFRFVMGAVGGVLAGYGMSVGFETHGHNISLAAQIFICIVVGVVGCVVLIYAYYLGIFVVGAVGGLLLSNVIYQLVVQHNEVTPDDTTQHIVLICVAIICGFIALCFSEFLLRLITPFIGGYLFVAAIDHLGGRVGWWTATLDPTSGFFRSSTYFGCPSGSKSCNSLLGVWLALFILGVIVQFTLHAREEGNGRQRVPSGSGLYQLPPGQQGPGKPTDATPVTYV
jgi:hypothetical protein